MYLLLGLYSLAIIPVLVFPNFYLSELLISFLPYHGIILFFLVLISCTLDFRIPKPSKKKGHSLTKINLKIKRFRLKSYILLFGIIITAVVNGQRASFYNAQSFSSQENFDITQEDFGLTFFFSNILKSNTDYDGLQKTISDLNPDVVLLVEYKQHHHDNIGKFLSSNYPYINRIIGEQDVVGNVIFSKYKLEDFAPKIYQGPRRYGYAAVHKDDKDYYFYLVHTSAPVNNDYFILRNKQFDLFGANFIEQDVKRLPDDRVVILGDFNVTPRSPTFKKFDRIINKSDSEMIHMSRFTSLWFSWGLDKRGDVVFPIGKHFIKSHIDHLWISQTTTLYDLQKTEIKGSDHDALFGRIY